MAEEKRSSFKSHSVTLEKREKVYLTGVLEVISFDEENVVAETEMGAIIIRGVNLHVSKLNLDNGELNIEGEIESLSYEDQIGTQKSKGSIISRLFK